ncbi:hypothetical protein [Azospirillum picis]|uniref:Uncharacterized protein n=1 Tax=Azospirillum picis TaxID=488438 RepID=A0ABU0MEH0_9PROT|nr:hypothetical protein [Azospirillum picis]MBP2297996.1 hypothetical protein [Azospirillum picis]MDQ0531834.1 hypothetical protein [Azospirillum picis]
MIHMVRTFWEATVDDRKSQPRDQKTAEKAAGHSADCTDYGQPAGSPGARGGTTCYGGIKRVQPRNRSADRETEKEE